MGELIFIKVLNMSLTGSFVILAVLVMRLFLRRVPRIFSYCLWGVVLFRLLCPVSFTAGFSLLGALEQPAISQGRMVYIPEELAMAGSQAGRQADAGNVLLADGADNKEGTNVGKGVLTATGIWERIFLPGDGVNVALWAGARIWLLGICVMAAYSLLTLMGLKRKLRGARWEEGDIYVTREVPMPFVMGLVKPRIYLPETLEEREKSYVLLHEQIHIRRRDHVVKILAFLALCIHWFNPFVWVAFFLSEKDMEMSCDEAVIRRTGSDVKKAYTASLLGMATGGHVVRGVPLAFGEGDTGSRIRNVLRYRKPAAMAVAVTAVGCAAAALVLLANPAKDKEELKQEVYYGVVSDILIEGNAQRVIQIPGWWDVADIPEADSVSVYFEREEQELLPGDMVQITFPAGEEVTVMETWPVMFAQKAESIVVLWGGLSLERIEGDTYRVTFAAGVVPGYETAKPGDILSIYWEEGDLEAPAYLSWVPEGENSVLVAQVPLLGAGEFSDGIRRFTVELTAEQIQRVFEGFGFHIRFALEQGVPAGRDGQPEEAEAGMEGTGDVYLTGTGSTGTGTGSTGTGTGSTGAGNTGSGDAGAGSVSVEDAGGVAEVYVEELGKSQAFWKGTRQVYVKSVSRSARVIDSYVTAGGDVQSEPELAFSKDCVFQANYSMSGADYREISFEEFADFIAEGRRPRGRQAVEKSCHLTFQNGLIVEAALDSIWYPYGIGFSTYTLQNDQHKFLMSQEGAEALEQNYILDSEEKVDISDREGMETIEVYVGDLGDGDSGIVLCRDAQGNLLSSQDAHVTRAGWNNIYVGEVAEGAFLLNVSIEDKWYSGEYGYWVYRLDEEGGLKQIAGSTFVFDIMDNSLTEYDDELFREWVDGMTAWLEDSHLLLATQGGELRTEKICEADRYCYETLGLKDRLEE